MIFALTLTSLILFKADMFLANNKNMDKKMPIFSVETPQKLIALTFNAAWDDADTAEILDILDANGIKASFFLCGTWLDKYPDLLKQIYAAGHDVGNHGDDHAHVASLSFDANVKEIMGAHKKVQDILGISMNLYRGPYGEYNATVVEAAKSQGYKMIQWNVDSLDWMNKGAEDLVNRVLNHKKLRNGSIVLFHTDAKHTAAVLQRVIDGLKIKGYAFVPVSELIYKDGYYIDFEGRQRLNELPLK